MPSVGRNQPCPCGSGSKFKKCCGKPGIHAESGVARPPEGTYFRLRISLLHATPEIWRRFLMRADEQVRELSACCTGLREQFGDRDLQQGL